MYCKHCGKEIADDSKFCQHCGKNLAIAEEKSTDKENRGGIIWQYVVKNKKTFLIYTIWLVLNILLYCFGQSQTYCINNPQDYFYPFTENNHTTLFYVGYYDITEFIVYVILIPLLLYFYFNVLNKPRTNSKKKEKSSRLDNDNGYQAFKKFHHDNTKIEQNKHNNSEEKRRSLPHINGNHIPNILKPLICPFLCRGGVLLAVLFLSMMIILSAFGLQQFYTEIGIVFFILVLALYPYLLLEYLNRDEAELLFDNIQKRTKVILFVSKIVLFESMFMSRSGAYFVCFISLIIVESNSSIGSSPMKQLGFLGAIILFPYIVYKYKKALDKYYH